MDIDTSAMRGKFDTDQMAYHMVAAFHRGETVTNPGAYLRMVHEDFARIAKKLGYRIERIQPEQAAA